jgi:hypothetical protein
MVCGYRCICIACGLAAAGLCPVNASLHFSLSTFMVDSNVRTLTVYSNKFTLVRNNELLIACHLNVSTIYLLSVSACPATYFHDSSKSHRHAQPWPSRKRLVAVLGAQSPVDEGPSMLCIRSMMAFQAVTLSLLAGPLLTRAFLTGNLLHCAVHIKRVLNNLPIITGLIESNTSSPESQVCTCNNMMTL